MMNSYLMANWGRHPEMSQIADEARYPFDAVGERHTKDRLPYSYDPFFIFGTRADVKKAADGLYSDRIFQWNREKARSCWERNIKDKRWAQASRAELSAFMSDYLDKEVRATALAEGCNVGNGYPYWIVWFEEVAAQPDESPDDSAPQP